VASGPENDGTVRHCQTGWVRQDEVGRCTRGTSAVKPHKHVTSSNLVDMGWAAMHAFPEGTRLPNRWELPGGRP